MNIELVLFTLLLFEYLGFSYINNMYAPTDIDSFTLTSKQNTVTQWQATALHFVSLCATLRDVILFRDFIPAIISHSLRQTFNFFTKTASETGPELTNLVMLSFLGIQIKSFYETLLLLHSASKNFFQHIVILNVSAGIRQHIIFSLLYSYSNFKQTKQILLLLYQRQLLQMSYNSRKQQNEINFCQPRIWKPF